jgi:D-arabinose 5-phosphate isomerase GutQ
VDNDLKKRLTDLDSHLARLPDSNSIVQAPFSEEAPWISDAVAARTDSIAEGVRATVSGSKETITQVTEVFLRWMTEHTSVRVLGAGRARLAASIPANRLAHGGAHVFVQDDIIPMPHTVRGGGVIAASASGQTPSVLEVLRKIRDKAPNFTVVGIAAEQAEEFRSLCSHFIPIKRGNPPPNPLSALADIDEYIISEVLDAVTVAAGKLGGFDDRKWRLGHENLGATGPYDADDFGSLQFSL